MTERRALVPPILSALAGQPDRLRAALSSLTDAATRWTQTLAASLSPGSGFCGVPYMAGAIKQAEEFAAAAAKLAEPVAAARAHFEKHADELARCGRAYSAYVLDETRAEAKRPTANPRPLSRSPQAHRALIHARYLARRCQTAESTANHPCTIDREAVQRFVLALAHASHELRILAHRLEELDPFIASVVHGLAGRFDELAAEVVLSATEHRTLESCRRTSESLAPPGRVPLSRCSAANAPPRVLA